MELIPSNIRNFTRQLTRIGAMYDWNHVVDTTDPSYYRWTQWLFLQLYRAGLAEKKEAPVNWCPSCHTVLANEQVIAGACERCGTTVEQRFLSQWFFRITEYAQRLLDNLAWIDWSETTRKAQENWIGRSEGAEIWFEVDTDWRRRPDPTPQRQWPPPGRITTSAARTTSTSRSCRSRYSRRGPTRSSARRSWCWRRSTPSWSGSRRPAAGRGGCVPRAGGGDGPGDRKKVEKEKTGVFTGAYAVNPATQEPVPVWIADYVLMEYGTGAIMAVPGHDERDFEFATQFGLPIVRVISGGETSESERRGRDGRVHRRGRARELRRVRRHALAGRHRPGHGMAGGAGRWRRRGSTSGCTTGASPASATGARPFPSSTATRAARCRCRRTSCPSCCRTSRTTSRMPAA
jgi:leucyl-tRNA synthetase